MAIKISDYTETEHKGILMSRMDDTRFLIRYYINGGKTTKTKLHRAAKTHSKRDRLAGAFVKREKLITESKYDDGSQVDKTKTLNDYFYRLLKLKGGDKEARLKRKEAKTNHKSKWSDEVSIGYEHYYKKHIQPKLGHMKMVDIKERHISELNEYTAAKGYADRTRKKAFEILIPMFDLAVMDEVIETSPYIASKHKIVRSYRKEKRSVRGDSRDKYKRVFNAIMKVYNDNPHHRALFLFGLDGRRKGETLLCEWDNIDMAAKTYTVPGEISKIDEDMTFEMSTELYEALLKFNDKSGKVFNIEGVNRHMTRLIREASKVPEFTYHWMRNLMVSALAADGVEASVLSGMLGHTDPNTVTRYLDLNRESSSRQGNKIARGLRA